jgi:hypothetical protein
LKNEVTPIGQTVIQHPMEIISRFEIFNIRSAKEKILSKTVECISCLLTSLKLVIQLEGKNFTILSLSVV